MSYRFGKLWHLAIIWAIRKAFHCIQQGVSFLLANHTRLSPTSKNESDIQVIFSSDFRVNVGFCIWKDIHNTVENSVESMKTSPDQTRPGQTRPDQTRPIQMYVRPFSFMIYIQVIFSSNFRVNIGFCIWKDIASIWTKTPCQSPSHGSKAG